MNADSAYAIGNSHEVCQDYARSMCMDGWAGVWVSDGCSSSPDSDVGARLVTLSAVQKFRDWLAAKAWTETNSVSDTGLEIASGAAIGIQMLGLPPEAMDATLLSYMTNGEDVMLSVYGDGMFFLKFADGRTCIGDIEFSKGYPDYLSYRIDGIRRKRYDKTVGASPGKVHKLWQTMDGAKEHLNIWPEVHKGYGEVRGTSHEDPRQCLVLAAVMSDGVKSFYKRREDGSSEPIPKEEVIDEIMAFKLTTGRFVQRRLNRFLKDAAKKGWEHYDDISVAAIHFG
jgi:hypothetical protein